MTAATVLYFLGASLALTIAPGPDNTFIVAQGISRGRKAAIVTALGMCSGISVHTTAAALGISALLYSSATAFQILKFAGAGYLLFLAWRALKEQQILLPQGATDGRTFRSLFRRGFVMNVINPKVALFFPCISSPICFTRFRKCFLADVSPGIAFHGTGSGGLQRHRMAFR